MVRQDENVRELLKNEIMKIYSEKGMDAPNLEFVVLKKNNCSIIGLSVQYANSDNQITPVLHIDDFISQLKNEDALINDTALHIFNLINREKQNPVSLKGNIKNQYRKENLILEVVSNKNQDFLKNIVYREDKALGLAYLVRLKVNNMDEINSNSLKTCVITNSLLVELGITEEQLFKDIESKPNCYILKNMIDIMADLVAETGLNFAEDKDSNLNPKMYVITNESKLYGASILYFSDQLAQILKSKKIKTAVILPSSIHEIIVLPYDENVDLDSYTAMVKEVNATQVIPEERLVDNAYLFDVETGEFSII